MTEERKPSSRERLFEVLDKISALPAEARLRLDEIWRGYLIHVDDPEHRALVAEHGRKIVEAVRTHQPPPRPDPRLAEGLEDLGPVDFDPGIIAQIQAVDELIMWLPRDEQRMLISLATIFDDPGVHLLLSHDNRKLLADRILACWAESRFTPR